MHQKWMKTRPRLNALEMYATGCDNKKGRPKIICNVFTKILSVLHKLMLELTETLQQPVIAQHS